MKCKHCGEWLNRPSALQQFSNTQPVWHFVLLSIITFGIYEIYWFYRNWKQLKSHRNWDISPAWRTVGLLVPILNIVLVYTQFRDIRDFAEEAGYDTHFSPGWTTFGYVILSGLSYLPDPLWFLYLISVWPLAVIQGVLNSYWRKEQPKLVERTKFSANQIALLVIGGILWIMVLIGTFVLEPLMEGAFPGISY